MKRWLILFLSSLAFAAEIEIASIETGNTSVDPQTVNMLVKSAIIQQGDSPVEQSDKKLRISLMPLGNSIIVVSELEDDGSVERSEKLKAESPEELDIVIERVVLATLSSKSPEENEEVTNITDEEANELKARKGVKRYHHFSLGPMFWHNMHGKYTQGVEVNYGYIWEVSPNAAITLMDYNAITMGDEYVAHVSVLIGGRYYFSARRNSPYIGLGFGIGSNLSTMDDMASFGFAGGINAGVVFFRTSEIQLEVGASYDINLDGFGFTHSAGKSSVFIGMNF